MSAAFSLVFGICCYAMKHNPNRATRYFLAGVGVLALLYGIGLRHNSLPAAVTLGPLLWYSFNSSRSMNWKHLVLIAIITISSVPIIGLIERSLFTIKKDYAIQFIMVHDIFGVFHHAEKNGKDTSQLPIPNYWLKNKPGIEWTPRQIAAKYMEYKMSPMLYDGKIPVTFDSSKIDILKSAWFQTVTTYPGMYLKHRWGTNRHLTRIGMYGTYYPYHLDSKKKNLTATTTLSNWIRAHVYIFYENLKNTIPAIFVPWVYLLLCTVVMVLGTSTWIFTERRDFRISFAISLALAGFLYLTALFFVGPSPDFRYAYWTQAASLISLIFLIKGLKNSTFRLRSFGKTW